MALSPVGDSEDASDSEDDGSDLFFLDSSGLDDQSLKLSYSDLEDESDSDDVDNRPDDPMDISGDLPPLFSFLEQQGKYLHVRRA